MKNKKAFVAVIISAVSVYLIIAALLCSTIFSYVKFGIVNPFVTADALTRVIFTEEEYVEISTSPYKVIVAKPDASLLDEYMESQGFERDDERQMGALCTFTDGNFEELIMYSQNGYYSTWCWQ